MILKGLFNATKKVASVGGNLVLKSGKIVVNSSFDKLGEFVTGVKCPPKDYFEDGFFDRNKKK